MITSLLLAMFIAAGGHVATIEPGRALVCGPMAENAIGGHSAACEWVRVTR